MANIDYIKVGWDTTKSLGPTNLNHMDDALKVVCDKMDHVGDEVLGFDVTEETGEYQYSNADHATYATNDSAGDNIAEHFVEVEGSVAQCINNITDIEGLISALQSGKVPFVDKGLDGVPELGFGGGWDGTQYYCTWCFYSSGERSRFAFQFKRPKESNTFYIRSWLWSNGWGEWKQIG